MGDVRKALAAHLGAGWIVVPEVRTCTGYGDPARGVVEPRRIDLVAVSVWPSTGLYVDGWEVKSSRGDWLRELRQPEKGARCAAVCDRYWLLTDGEGIARAEEIPDGWGFAVRTSRGIGVIRRPGRGPDTWPAKRDPGFVASLVRAAARSRGVVCGEAPDGA